jgi:replication factor C subunit 2/4
MLQSLHRLYGEAMSPQAVLDTSGALPPDRVSGTFDMCRRNDFSQMSSWVADLLADGFPVSQVVAQMLDYVVEATDIDSIRKAKIAVALAEADKQLTDGAGDYLQLMNVLATTTRNLV